VVFEKEYITRCSSAEWIARNGCWRWLTWDDAIVVSAGKLRKLWDSLGELRSSLYERRLEKTVLRPALFPVKTAQYSVFPSGMTSHGKIAQCNWECIGRLISPLKVWYRLAQSELPHSTETNGISKDARSLERPTMLAEMLTSAVSLNTAKNISADRELPASVPRA
jgi:hypothetical protein